MPKGHEADKWWSWETLLYECQSACSHLLCFTASERWHSGWGTEQFSSVGSDVYCCLNLKVLLSRRRVKKGLKTLTARYCYNCFPFYIGQF